jgi:molybdenum cofactor synthesis domain-containing protein
MPREGVFAEVLKEGVIKPGDEMEFLPLDPDRPFTACVITLSDRAYEGTYEDKSGPLMVEILKEAGYEIVEYILLPDNKNRLKRELIRLADQRQVNVIFTTGGTGFSERDITPEATLEVCDRHAPGIAEAMRWYSLSITPKAMLSRQASGIRKKTLIVNMPGSPKAVKEDLDFILKPLAHGLGILRRTDTD